MFSLQVLCVDGGDQVEVEKVMGGFLGDKRGRFTSEAMVEHGEGNLRISVQYQPLTTR